MVGSGFTFYQYKHYNEPNMLAFVTLAVVSKQIHSAMLPTGSGKLGHSKSGQLVEPLLFRYGVNLKIVF